MVNFNGKLVPPDTTTGNHDNRGLRFGDALFETMRVVNGTIYFWEEHYLRLMASMRILRMEIPMEFTMEILEKQLLELLKANELQDKAARVRFTIFRNAGGLYLPQTNDISYYIESSLLETPFYLLSEEAYEVELFKDFYVNPDMLSTLKTNNKMLNVVGSIFAAENGYQNCLLLNNAKQVVETLNGNLFLVKDKHIKTPPLKAGCLNGIVRKKLLGMLTNLPEYTIAEEMISPFELQKADELFTTNTIVGIQPITKYRKKQFRTSVAKELLGKLNAQVRLANAAQVGN